MKTFFYTVFFAVCSCVCCMESIGQQPANSVQKIVIIRHGEKPAKGDNLSCQGFNRSLQLPAVLNKKFKVFDYIFVPSLNEGGSTKHSRMFQTIVPYGVGHNLDIN